ncbi:MAG: Asp-tRNA(Asn)/Glu-tRNA(Gln) amidotransferase subunit GatB [Holosporales bacterium]|jgi:aspartyl-tRNA(Asn)/glutamyl-tRNA(Gln) amidotransferase subunit B|nr:Asp-tRNA(Asn)/Glu-tRNA(Gln) amidotransferase subunit GatB [Holosporales bacterium]
MVCVDNLVNGWEVVIGLEIHAQISTKSKLFSSSSTDFGAEPNTQVSFYDAAMPGTLPVLNNLVIDQVVKTGLGIRGKINTVSKFDRKNYFYPDLPAGYQISQFYYPIVTNGHVNIPTKEGNIKTIHVERIHIEQDAGKSIHDLSAGHSCVDLNRAGVPLMEIVSKPDIRSSYEAMQYVRTFRTLLRYLGSCDCNMERGNLRVDANISIRKPGTQFGNRVEIKNINSIKFLGDALNYEIERQIIINESGNNVFQETRLFDPSLGETRSMRSKENASDYRYFPDPDLKPVVLSEERIARIKMELPELPDEKYRKFTENYCLTPEDANILIEEKAVADSFEIAISASKIKTKESIKLIANWITGELFAVLNKEGKTIEDINFPIEYIAELVDLILDKTISGKIAKTVFSEIIKTCGKPREIVKRLGLIQIQDESVIQNAVEEVVVENAPQVMEYRAGKTQLFGFFVGTVMKKLQGRGNPELINKVLKERL